MMLPRMYPAPLHLLMLTALAALAGATIAGCGRQQTAHGAQMPASQVSTTQSTASVTSQAASTLPADRIVTVRKGSLRRYAPAVGTFRARQKTLLGPQINGRVEKVLVDVGDRVRAGQVVVQLDPTFFRLDVQMAEAAVAAARAALASSEANLEEKSRERDRQNELFERGVGSTKDRDDALTAFQRAHSDRDEMAAMLGQVQQRLDYAKEKLRETEIRAPYDAAVTARLVDPGEPANSAPVTNLLEVQEVGNLYLEFSLPQELLDKVIVGTPLEFDVEGVAGGTREAKVSVVFPAIDEKTRSFRCRALIDNADGRLSPGLLAEVRAVAQEVRDTLVLPRTAVQRTSGGWQTLVLENGQPVARKIEVGVVAEERVEVAAGLHEGDQVVTATAAGS